MLTSVIIPLPFGKIKQLATVAPDVKKLVKNYVEEGIDNLNSIIDNIHSILADEIDGITKNDIRDIIAGNYDAPKRTRSEIQTMIMDLKVEAQLLSKIDILENGGQPTSENAKKARNQRTKELRDRVKELKQKTGGENTSDIESSKLNAVKTKLENEIKKLEEELRTGNFEFAEEPKPIELDQEAIDLKDKLIKLKYERAKRLIQEEYATRSTGKKIGDTALEILNVPRTLMSSFDFSAPLRQGLIPTISHPLIAGPALIEMFKQAVSQKRFDRWFHDLRESKFFDLISKSGLYVADPHDIRLSTKEEYFMNNYAEKIPLIGKVIKGSERAYVTYLNKMRVDLFKQGAEVLAAQGKTFENSPEIYKALAGFINNSTGRGELGKLEDYAPILNSIFFSPRLIASRLNLLNPAYYAKLPKEVRVRALADMAKFIGFGLSVLALLKYGFPCKDKNDKNCVEVQNDPRSSEFGKIKVGNTRYDTWGGFQQYITFLTKAIMAQKITQGSDRVQELDGKGRGVNTRLSLIGTFVRGKLAPIPGLGVDYLSGMTQDYQKFSWKKEAENKLLPLIYSDLKEAVSQDGVKSLFTVGIPGAFGVGVQTYDDKKPNK